MFVCECVWLQAFKSIHRAVKWQWLRNKTVTAAGWRTLREQICTFYLRQASQQSEYQKKKRSRSSFLKRGEEGEEEGEEEEDEGEVYEGNRSKEGREQLGAGDGSWKLKKTSKDLSPAFSHPVQVLGFEPNQKCVCLQVKKCWVGGGGLTWCCWHRPLPSGKRK